MTISTSGYRRRIRWIVISLLLLVLVVGIWLGATSHRSPDPVYRGVRLSDWLLAYFNYSQGHGAGRENKREEAREAIQAIGTNGLSLMVEMLASHDTEIERRIANFLPSRICQKFGIGDAWDRIGAAKFGFFVLQDAAAPAIPQLKNLLTNACSDTRIEAIGALYYVSRTTEEYSNNIAWCLSDPDVEVQKVAASALERLTNHVN